MGEFKVSKARREPDPRCHNQESLGAKNKTNADAYRELNTDTNREACEDASGEPNVESSTLRPSWLLHHLLVWRRETAPLG